MAENTLTGLAPDLYEAMDIVSREMTGLIPSVTMDVNAAQTASVGQNIRVDIEPAAGAGVDITPAMTVPEPTGETSGYSDIQITKAKAYEFGFNGEGAMGLETGAGYGNVRAAKIAQRIRRLVNDVETDLAGLQSTFSRAYGTAGTTPFATAGDYSDASFVQKILLDNGAPEFDNSLVMNTTAGATLKGKQAQADMAGSDVIQRQGILLPLSGLDLRQSAQIATTGSNVITGTVEVTGVNAIGATTINLTTAAGAAVSGVAGDMITIASDGEKYILAADVTIGASTTGDIVIAEPGLRKATTATLAVSGVAASARNMCFNRSALVLASRAPARPIEGDMAEDVMLMTDPRSGLTFEVSMYKGYRKVRYEIALAWGVKNIKPEHTALLLG